MLFARFSINLKLLLLSTLPLLVLIAFLSKHGKSLYDTYKNSYQTKAIIEFAFKLEDIAHQHARKRDLTKAFLATNHAFSKGKMLKQRENLIRQLTN
jgi:hypothetical protein